MKQEIKLTEQQLHSLIKEHLQKMLVKEDINSMDDMFEELVNIVDQDFMNIANKACQFMEQKGLNKYPAYMRIEIYNHLYDALDDWFTRFTED